MIVAKVVDRPPLMQQAMNAVSLGASDWGLYSCFDSGEPERLDRTDPLKNTDADTMVIMERWRERRGEPRLCMLDLTMEERVQFGEEVKEYKLRNRVQNR